MNYNYFLPCFVSAAAILAAGGALAQQCVQAPSCAELGYTDSISDCANGSALYCPFDKTKVFCREIKELEPLDCGSYGFSENTPENCGNCAYGITIFGSPVDGRYCYRCCTSIDAAKGEYCIPCAE